MEKNSPEYSVDFSLDDIDITRDRTGNFKFIIIGQNYDIRQQKNSHQKDDGLF